MEESHHRLLRNLTQAWSQTSSSLWSEANPARGQCGVTAVVVQDRLGGEILKTRVAAGAWHFYNRVDGRRLDLTAQQFDQTPDYEDVPATRADAFSDTNQEQYRALSQRLSAVEAQE